VHGDAALSIQRHCIPAKQYVTEYRLRCEQDGTLLRDNPRVGRAVKAANDHQAESGMQRDAGDAVAGLTENQHGRLAPGRRQGAVQQSIAVIVHEQQARCGRCLQQTHQGDEARVAAFVMFGHNAPHALWDERGCGGQGKVALQGNGQGSRSGKSLD